ncbi:16S rRNA (cytosine(967)-C(5))-methyltransferase RsmB [Companilactobacillus metriopterae]|uniref:16S rRNA (cytosine(967)-C(5))-methyltransferase RsmB n=1 Tax=Companilactobacillus metriopterae TaxID=1909267 RepID=UPI00100BDE7A|nr:16S rRNA (cytosine(967)-C(5))-methyltransferase RsmB [Companilactobacillus metriopterae]
MKTNPRAVAVEALNRVIYNQAFSNIEINNLLNKYELTNVDSRLMTNIVYGVLQHKLTLEYQLEPYIKGRVVDRWINTLLLTAIYQMEYLDKVPDHAVLNESVNVAKQFGRTGVGKFVTGVLRSYQRTGSRELPSDNSPESLSIVYSVPVWLVNLFINQFGMDKTLSILKTINEPSDISIRVNTSRISREELKQRLEDQNFDVHDSKLSEQGLVVKSGNLVITSEFQKGLFTIQDESSMMVAPFLDVKEDSIVLDSCAAPGGKTTHIASYLTTGKVIALDIHKNKTKLIRENAERLGYSDVVETKALDARKSPDEFDKESFDRILVDAPCSGLGLIRRKPELRYFRTQEDLDNLQKIQLDILNNVSSLLKVNGKLVFSTCTFDNEENGDVVEMFLANNPNFELEKKVDNPMKLFPDDYFTDGFFIASFVKKQ